MAFLTETDYKQLIAADDLEIVQQSDEDTRIAAEATAIEYFKGFLRSRYDVDTIFDEDNDDRNPVIVLYLMDEVLYILHSSVPGRFIPENRILRKEQLDKWLDKVQRGLVNPGFPLIDDEDTGAPIRCSSNTKVSGYKW